MSVNRCVFQQPLQQQCKKLPTPTYPRTADSAIPPCLSGYSQTVTFTSQAVASLISARSGLSKEICSKKSFSPKPASNAGIPRVAKKS